MTYSFFFNCDHETNTKEHYFQVLFSPIYALLK